MPTDLGAAFSTLFEGIPPHVSQEDFPLWEQFRKRFVGEYVRFYFDVALGEGEGAPVGTRPSVAAAWRRLTMFRADVVGERVNGWDLIELRPNAGPGAIGALQMYSTLWLSSPPDGRPLRPVLVTDRCAEDVKRVAAVVGITMICLNELGG